MLHVCVVMRGGTCLFTCVPVCNTCQVDIPRAVVRYVRFSRVASGSQHRMLFLSQYVTNFQSVMAIANNFSTHTKLKHSTAGDIPDRSTCQSLAQAETCHWPVHVCTQQTVCTFNIIDITHSTLWPPGCCLSPARR